MSNLISFLLFAIIGAIICNGWYEITRSGMIFGFWEDFWEKYTQETEGGEPKYRFSKWIRFPLSACPTCFASIYGTLIFIAVIRWEGIQTIGLWIAYVLSLAYLNTFFHNKLSSK